MAGPDAGFLPPDVPDYWDALQPEQKSNWKVRVYHFSEGKAGSTINDELYANRDLVSWGLANFDLLAQARVHSKSFAIQARTHGGFCTGSTKDMLLNVFSCSLRHPNFCCSPNRTCPTP